MGIKVLLLGRSFKLSGGVTNYLELLIQNLPQEKFQVKHFVQGKSPTKWKNIFLPFVILSQLIKFKRILKTYQPDVVHINPSLGWTAIIRDFAFLKIAKKKRIPVLFFIHGWQHTLSNKFKEKGYWKNYFKKRFALCDAIVVLAKEFKEELIKLGIPEERMHVSSTMVESEKYIPNSKGFSKSLKILFCANMNRKKGPYEVLKAAPFVLKKYPDTKFIFVGEGEELENLRKMSRKLGVESNIIFTGYISPEEKNKIFKNSSIFVYPSYHGEGFPTVILEAMAAGMPLVTTPVGGLADALVDGIQGLIIKSMPPKPEEVAEKIIALIEDPELMKKISENNLQEAKKKYDVKVVSRKIEKLYISLKKNSKDDTLGVAPAHGTEEAG